MNMNQIINMVLRRVMSIVINKGINVGVDQVAKRKNRNTSDHSTHADIALDKKRLRQTAKMSRRLTKL